MWKMMVPNRLILEDKGGGGIKISGRNSDDWLLVFFKPLLQKSKEKLKKKVLKILNSIC